MIHTEIEIHKMSGGNDLREGVMHRITQAEVSSATALKLDAFGKPSTLAHFYYEKRPMMGYNQIKQSQALGQISEKRERPG